MVGGEMKKKKLSGVWGGPPVELPKKIIRGDGGLGSGIYFRAVSAQSVVAKSFEPFSPYHRKFFNTARFDTSTVRNERTA